MVIFRKNYKDLDIRITDERINHIEVDHPEMSGLINWIEETLFYRRRWCSHQRRFHQIYKHHILASL